jgi:hypothetical protein
MIKSIPSVSVNYACTGRSTNANELGMRPMQERAYEKLFEMYTEMTAEQKTVGARKMKRH